MFWIWSIFTDSEPNAVVMSRQSVGRSESLLVSPLLHLRLSPSHLSSLNSQNSDSRKWLKIKTLRIIQWTSLTSLMSTHLVHQTVVTSLPRLLDHRRPLRVGAEHALTTTTSSLPMLLAIATVPEQIPPPQPLPLSTLVSPPFHSHFHSNIFLEVPSHRHATMQFVLNIPQLSQPFAQVQIVMDAGVSEHPIQEQTQHHIQQGSRQQHLDSRAPRQHAVREHHFTFDTSPISRERIVNFLTGMTGQFGPAVFMTDEHEPDLKRGETILKELEVVPRGLIQRINVVGGVLGGIDLQPTSEEQIVCPVCWEPLLGESIFGSEKETANEIPNGDATSETNEVDTEETRKAILALPCRHIFHGSCLLPWLSRQTTCPSCRFNLDPEELTVRYSTTDFAPWGIFPPGVRTGANFVST